MVGKVQSYSSIRKYYAVLKNNYVVHWFVGTLDEAEKEMPGHTFIEVTVENSPISVGEFWDGTKFVKEKQWQ